jgi:hypothetical protein
MSTVQTLTVHLSERAHHLCIRQGQPALLVAKDRNPYIARVSRGLQRDKCMHPITHRPIAYAAFADLKTPLRHRGVPEDHP